MLKLLAWMLLAAAAQPVAARAPAPDAVAGNDRALLRRVQKNYAHKAITAHFCQVYTDAAMGPRPAESGTLAIDASGRMLFSYQTPEAKTFLFDGNSASFSEPAAAQITILTHFTGSKAGAALALLTGGSAQQDSFRLTPCQQDCGPVGKDERALRFVPTEAVNELSYAVLLVAPSSAEILAVTLVDALHNETRYSLSARQIGAVLPEGLFVRQIPKGFSVLQGDARSP